MGKPGSGGGIGGGASLFTTNFTADGATGLAEYRLISAIPTAYKIWLGQGQYSSPDKSITFEIRGNITGQSTGADAQTTLLYASTVGTRSGLVAVDMYKSGTLHVASVLGTGVEKVWLKLKSKSGTLGSWYASVNYTTE
jgi:hypothetical protein